MKVSELRLVSEKRLRNTIGHISFENEKMQEILKIAHRFYFSTYDYKLNQLEKIKEQYKLETFDQLKNNFF